MSRALRDGPSMPEGNPTMSEIEVYRFCRSLLEWENVHLEGEERVGESLRVLLSTDDGHKEWCNSLAAAEEFRARYGEPATP
jgi:hypothetical protein